MREEALEICESGGGGGGVDLSSGFGDDEGKGSGEVDGTASMFLDLAVTFAQV